MHDLTGRVALVTGAAQGIGHAVATALAEAGATVVATDVRDQSDLGDHIRTRSHDVTDAERWAAVVAEIEADHGRLDILVNNAGVSGYDQLHELSLEEWNRIIGINQTGVLLGMQHALRLMRPARSGAIVNISSICGATSVPGVAAYHASKHAVLTMTKNAAVSYAREGIRANAVLPGWIRTPLTLGQTDELNGAFLDATPMGVGGDPEDVAAAVCFLVSDQARFITGVDLPVDGGYLAR
ncbi:SDR family NAD(P)-dependent oxidoreductase [Nocardioides sp. REDSEA-S30_B4]|jgi:3alpha(or 20beta)-hydroxysteroid dehydrogenase|uniref:SDR family NAD(P)-dependent oxidoreductase n=1 Tax=Nocardioides sp. REDSEA-S30_B4 TaxID=1811552 RepID=UPI000A639228|nr:SDR family NAD(P)-dependent oxidoreductase [Nocardioides sp. REDSEA-S30_B4]